ncbi:MAG: polysaccharide biosynthesis protein [Candidatus Margulisiibacteriota bacterium]
MIKFFDQVTYTQKLVVLILADTLAAALAWWVAFVFRFSFVTAWGYLSQHLWLLPIFMGLRIVIYLYFDLYKISWRFASTRDFLAIAKAVGVATLALITILYGLQKGDFPKSVVVLDGVLNFMFVAAVRVSVKLFVEYSKEKTLKNRTRFGRKRALIIGAGEGGDLIARQVLRQFSDYEVVGFIDENPNKKGLRIHGLPVLGNMASLSHWVSLHRIDEAIIAIPSATGAQVRDIVTGCEQAEISFKITPGLNDILEGTYKTTPIRDVQIEDLLGRDVVETSMGVVDSYLQDKVVLVTGAGGSIGSELCRQIAHHHPKNLVLLDNSETALFYAELDIRQLQLSLGVEACVANVSDATRMKAVFELYRPQVVFHAAAYKHVPLMEGNPREAVINNILGTKTIIELSHRFGVERFVLISTDKAVNPTNCMGASKRVCEWLMQQAAQDSKTVFSAVRFGNVLGSQGSVVPLFKQQIAKGGPVTVTHPDITRYFMTIPEAVRLVLQAGALSAGGEIFVLDMGEPVKIVQLAKDLIHLSGLEEGREIQIVFTGLRPGEKLYEELFYANEALALTPHRKIFKTPLAPVREDLLHRVEGLILDCDQLPPQELGKALMALVSLLGH